MKIVLQPIRSLWKWFLVDGDDDTIILKAQKFSKTPEAAAKQALSDFIDLNRGCDQMIVAEMKKHGRS